MELTLLPEKRKKELEPTLAKLNKRTAHYLFRHLIIQMDSEKHKPNLNSSNIIHSTTIPFFTEIKHPKDTNTLWYRYGLKRENGKYECWIEINVLSHGHGTYLVSYKFTHEELFGEAEA